MDFLKAPDDKWDSTIADTDTLWKVVPFHKDI